MKLNLSDVLSEQHKTIETEVLLEMTEVAIAADTFQVLEKELVRIRIEYAGEKKLEITGSCAVTVAVPCDRCLKETKICIPIAFVKKVLVDSDQSLQTDEADENNYIDGYNLDVEQLIYNELLVGWPTKILCSEDCKGICNVCGQNLNEAICNCEATGLDPRMSVIRDVFKNFKEV